MSKREQLTIKVESLTDGVLIQLAGELEISQCARLQIDLNQAYHQKPARLVIDLSGVPYMDSSGVAVLIQAHKTQRHHEGRLVLCCLQPKVRGLIEIARLHSVFTIVTDRAAAIVA